MNSLEKYIGDLNPCCWLNAAHVNGYGTQQPVVGEDVTEWKDISGNNKHFTRFNFWLYGVENPGNNRLTSPPKFNIDLNENSNILVTGNEEALGITLGDVFTNDNNLIITIGLGTIGTKDGGNNHGVFLKPDYTKWMHGNPFSNLDPQEDSPQLTSVMNLKSNYHGDQYNSYAIGFDGENGKILNGFLTDGYVKNTHGVYLDNVSTHNTHVNGWKLYDYRYDYLDRSPGASGLIVGNVVKNYWYDFPDNNQSWIYAGVKKYYEVICFDRFLIQSELRMIQTYIKLKYNI